MRADKLEVAKEFGATDGILATTPKPWTEAKRIAGRGADVVLVAVGAIAAYDTATRYLANGGRMVAVGMPHSGAKSEWEPVIFAYTGTAMIGSNMGDTVLPRDIPWITDLYLQGRLKLDELISGRWTLDQINEAIADTRTGAGPPQRHRLLTFFCSKIPRGGRAGLKPGPGAEAPLHRQPGRAAMRLKDLEIFTVAPPPPAGAGATGSSSGSPPTTASPATANATPPRSGRRRWRR